jgi:uncharacterized protein involved in response to NO
MLNIEDPRKVKAFGLFNLGFRPFFLLGGLFAAVFMALWMALYIFGANFLPAKLPSMVWHGHEMVYGYGVAVAGGFLLTAIKNWTNIQTIHGNSLMGLSVLWILARLMPFSGLDSALILAAAFDITFIISLLIATSSPIVKVKQWNHLPIILKIALLVLSNLLFYLGLFNILPPVAVNWGLYAGLYLIISLIMILGRRVIPFFIEKGVDEQVTIKNWKWLDLSNLYIFLTFTVVEVFFNLPIISALLAGILFIMHSIRLWGWHTKGIWKKPLLWVLYVGYAFIVLGFGLHAIAGWAGISPWLPLHAFAVGGIGIITTGMMARVSLGHTGRNVFDPPKIVGLIFGLLIAAAIIRVIIPIFLPNLYIWWIGMAQACWITAFGIFTFVYGPMFIKARVDGRPG